MDKRWIKNFNELATSPNREKALLIAEAGLDAIDTKEAISRSLKLEGNVINVMGESFDLSKFKNIKVVGFGKASCDAAVALEKILGSRIKEGAVIGLQKIPSRYIEIFAGTHPRPSDINLEGGEKIYETIKDSDKEDLVIVLVSGGGSALLCYTEEECEQGIKLYDSFLKTGKTITEINTGRKHLSLLKGGGLAKIAYPATVIGLIFSDIPGDRFCDVASGPTYKDETTVADAETIIRKYDLGHFDLTETPKEDKYFEKVRNFVLVSNKTAVEAMAKKGEEFGLKPKIISTELYDEIGGALKKIFSIHNEARKGFFRVLGKNPQTTQKPFSGFVSLADGEPSIEIKDKKGKGGRSLHMGLQAIKMKMVDENSVFISFASDGMDNSDVAGAIVDKKTLEKGEKFGLDAGEYLERFDSYTFFQKTGNMIMTGPTGANVSDLMILLTKK